MAESEEQKGTPCPLCGDKKLKNGDNMVYCEEYKKRKDGNKWFNEGDCEFHISRKNPVFGKNLTDKDIKTLLEGGSLKNSKGDVMTLDLENTDFFTHIEFKIVEKKEDKDF